MFLTGKLTPIPEMNIEQRREVLHRWRTSPIYDLRGLFRQLTSLAKVVFTASNANYHRLTGFPTTPAGWRPPPTYPYEFIQFPPAAPRSPSPEVVDTDVVIVGSGCGAGVCAKALAEAGHSVLVLDKGHHHPSTHLPMDAPAHLLHMVEGAGAVTSDDNSVLVVAGSCFGGGGTINWSASLQTQGFVRREWAEDRGLAFFATQAFQDSLDRVCAQMGVHEDFAPNHGNQALLDGARKLGWSARKVPQNTGGCEHAEGHCALGCWSGEKKGPVNGWFPDAARAGARFVEGFYAKRVLFDDTKDGKKAAVGVVGTWTSRGKGGVLDGPEEDKIVREVVVKAKKVLVCAGTLNSPCILKNSGLKVSIYDEGASSSAAHTDPVVQNPQIGRNLYLHPVNVMSGYFKEDVKPWEGGILTTVVNTFEDLDGKGHGAKLECLSMMPCYAMQFANWDSGLEFKLDALKYRHMNSYISIVRDRDPGYVYPDPITGAPRVNYTPSAFDRRHAMVGNVALAKILYLQGAAEIHAALPGMRPFVRDDPAPAATAATSSPAAGAGDDILASVRDAGVADPRFRAWLAELERHGNRAPESPFVSAHQMGTCRMSTSEGAGVVDPRGRVWGAEGLYVVDASVFPSASGVNPMVTNMAIADWCSQGIVQDLAAGGGRARL